MVRLRGSKSVASPAAILVGVGIFLSRISGLVREKVFAYYFGSSAAGDVFRAALRIPNFLQNLLGEGVLSGSFIPVYARLLAENKTKEARDLAGAVLGILSALTVVTVLAGMAASPLLIDLIAPGFEGERRALCIQIVRILFPGLGLLVLSAFCLGVLNSHKKFFLSYSAPVLWNLAIVVTLVIWAAEASDQNALAVLAAYGVLAGCFLQLTVQVPSVVKLLRGLPFNISSPYKIPGGPLHRVVKSFFPIVTGRGVVQISAYLDTMIASFLPIGALSILGYAQTLYLLPVSLFGMSISAAELPLMSQTVGTETEIAKALCERVKRACRKVSIFIVPSVVAFIFMGPYILRILYWGGAFDFDTMNRVWYVLVGSSLGLLATTQARVMASSFYALRDAKTPLRIAVIRVCVSTILGALLAFYGPKLLGLDALYGTVGLTLAFGVSSWIEWFLLRQKLRLRVGDVSVSFVFSIKLWIAALVPGLLGFVFLKMHPQVLESLLNSLLMLGAFAALYLGFIYLLKVEEVKEILKGKQVSPN